MRLLEQNPVHHRLAQNDKQELINMIRTYEASSGKPVTQQIRDAMKKINEARASNNTDNNV